MMYDEEHFTPPADLKYVVTFCSILHHLECDRIVQTVCDNHKITKGL